LNYRRKIFTCICTAAGSAELIIYQRYNLDIRIEINANKISSVKLPLFVCKNRMKNIFLATRK